MKNKISKKSDKVEIVNYLWDNDYLFVDNNNDYWAIDHIRVFYNTSFDTANKIVKSYKQARACFDISKTGLISIIFGGIR